MREVRRPAARVVCLWSDRLILLLRWRDPGSGAEMWEPPGGGIEPGENAETAARRELLEEAGLAPVDLLGPVLVPRDFVWDGARRVGDEAFFLAKWDDAPAVRLERHPELLGYAWVEERALPGLGIIEPPTLVDVITRLRTARPSPPSR